nr:type VII secretion target [Salinispora pacifica]
MTELRVAPDLLDRAAGACADLREDLRRSAADIGDETGMAVSGLPGWQTRAALEQLHESWLADLTRLTGYLDQLGDAFGDCARDYRYSDEANAAHFDIRGR